MSRLLTICLLCTIALLAPCAPRAAHAQTTSLTPPVPASVFPAGTDVTYLAVVGNQYYSCQWAMDCGTGDPLYHTTTGADLHRTGGWGEALSYAKGIRLFYWELYISTFDTAQHARAALKDMRTALVSSQGVVVHAPTMPGPALAETLVNPDAAAEGYALATVVGSTLAEGVAIRVNPQHGERPLARQSLVTALRDALAPTP